MAWAKYVTHEVTSQGELGFIPIYSFISELKLSSLYLKTNKDIVIKRGLVMHHENVTTLKQSNIDSIIDNVNMSENVWKL